MTVANLERIYPIKVYKKCRNVGKRLAIGAFSLIFIEIVLRNVSIQFWGTTFQASAGGRSPKNCATKLTIFIGKLSLEAGSHNPFFPFSFLSSVGRSNPGTRFQAACMSR